MKKGLTQILKVSFDIDLDTVNTIEFAFAQGGEILYSATYPDSAAYRLSDEADTVCVKFTPEIYALFSTGSTITMDTRISLLDTDENPETNQVSLALKSSLFS